MQSVAAATRRIRRALIALFIAPVFLSQISCLGGQLPHERKRDEKRRQEELEKLAEPGLVIGEFPLARKAVIDGDTIRVKGLDASLRLLGIDAEETFKHEKEKRAFEAGWEAYLSEMRGSSKRPVKMATPVGMDGKDFAQKFFEDVDTVRLERDHPKEIRDYYDRYLAYVFVTKDGKELNYNVECVRAGMSPYFTKYGYSRRFHDEFVQAEKEAREAKRGIWDPDKQHYPDYDERLPWWNGRAAFIKDFEDDAVGKENYIVLTNWDAISRLEAHVGKEVVVLGAVSQVKRGGKGPTRVTLSRRRGRDFPLIFFDKDVFETSQIEAHSGEYVRVRGFVSKYTNKHRHNYELQIVVDLPGQVDAVGDADDKEGADGSP